MPTQRACSTSKLTLYRLESTLGQELVRPQIRCRTPSNLPILTACTTSNYIFYTLKFEVVRDLGPDPRFDVTHKLKFWFRMETQPGIFTCPTKCIPLTRGSCAFQAAGPRPCRTLTPNSSSTVCRWSDAVAHLGGGFAASAGSGVAWTSALLPCLSGSPCVG